MDALAADVPDRADTILGLQHEKLLKERERAFEHCRKAGVVGDYAPVDDAVSQLAQIVLSQKETR